MLHFTLMKDLKFVVYPSSTSTFFLMPYQQHGKVCKPYNSILGEHFCVHWNITPTRFPNSNSPVTISNSCPSFVLETASMRSTVSSSSKSTKSGHSSFLSKAPKSPSMAATSVEAEADEAQALKRLSKLSLATGEGPTLVTGTGKTARVVYVTEQVSHHSPSLRTSPHAL